MPGFFVAIIQMIVDGLFYNNAIHSVIIIMNPSDEYA